MLGMGISEILLVLVVGAVWLIPVAAAVWVLVTLHRIRESQDALQSRLAAIEQMLQRR